MSENKFVAPVTLDFESSDEFETANHKYKVYLDAISIDRFSVLQQKEIECLGYYSLIKPIEFQNELTKAFNEQNYAYLGKLLYDRTWYYHYEKKNVQPILDFCTVFIYREDEDPKVYDQKIAKEKVQDWMKEGFDILPFFTLSVKASPTLLTAFNNFTQTILDKGLKQGKTQEEDQQTM